MFHSFPRPGLHSTRGALRNAGCRLEGYLRLDAKTAPAAVFSSPAVLRLGIGQIELEARFIGLPIMLKAQARDKARKMGLRCFVAAIPAANAWAREKKTRCPEVLTYPLTRPAEDFSPLCRCGHCLSKRDHTIDLCQAQGFSFLIALLPF